MCFLERTRTDIYRRRNVHVIEKIRTFRISYSTNDTENSRVSFSSVEKHTTE